MGADTGQTPGAPGPRWQRQSRWCCLLAVLGSPAAVGAETGEASTRFNLATHGIEETLSTEDKVANVRLLTASCAACHGTNGYSVGITPVLAGLGRDYFIQQMVDFRSGARPGTVMNHNASAYTPAEIAAMADFFAALPRTGCDR